MNLIFLDISMRLEDWLEKQLKDTNYSNYIALVCAKEELFPLLKQGLIYDVISFENNDKVIDNNSEEFPEIIRLIEEKRKVLSWYGRMIDYIQNNNPELIEEEMIELVIGGGPTPFVILVASILTVLTWLLIFPISREAIFNWVN